MAHVALAELLGRLPKPLAERAPIKRLSTGVGLMFRAHGNPQRAAHGVRDASGQFGTRYTGIACTANNGLHVTCSRNCRRISSRPRRLRRMTLRWHTPVIASALALGLVAGPAPRSRSIAVGLIHRKQIPMVILAVHSRTDA